MPSPRVESSDPRHREAWSRVVPVFPLGPAKDFPFRSEVVQITPAEWTQLLQGNLKLNRDWGDLERAKKVAHGD